MSTSLNDLSKCGDLDQLAEVIAVFRCCAPNYEPLLVGAMARDVLLSYAHEIPVARATMDIDLAFSVDDWKAYEGLQTALLTSGKSTKDPHIQHRLIFDGAIKVDLLPFGGVERADRTIAWPPGGDIVLRAVGYREAMAKSVTVKLPKKELVAVASLPAQAVLKLMAWGDRHYREPLKDASDLWLFMYYYLEAGNLERFYEEAAQLLNDPPFDFECFGAWLLGYDARRVLLSGNESEMALDIVEHILEPETHSEGQLRLAGEMKKTDPEAALNLLCAFHLGLKGKVSP
jgi:predicted nucleotidyltransferase